MRWALSILLFFFFSSLFGQPADIARLESAFQEAAQKGDRDAARKAFLSLLERDSLRAAALESQVHGLVYDLDDPSPEDLATMLRIYRIGLSAFPEDRVKWLKSRAVFAFRWHSEIEDAGEWLLEALEADPLGADLALVDMWMETVEAALNRKKSAMGMGLLVTQWGRVDRLLYMREISKEAAAEDLASRMGLRRKVITYANTCAGLKNMRWQNDTQAFHALALCPQSLEGKIDQYAADATDDPAWAFRLKANLALNSGDRTAFSSLLKIAMQYEKQPLLKADLHCQRAMVLAQMGQHRNAQAELKAAIKLAPEWGRPYLQLADLYASSMDGCGFSEFDRKAVYWLALDVILAGRNQSKGFESNLNERYVAYSSRMPSIEEAGFRGLGSGDTWPIKCWMNTVTTVKIH